MFARPGETPGFELRLRSYRERLYRTVYGEETHRNVVLMITEPADAVIIIRPSSHINSRRCVHASVPLGKRISLNWLPILACSHALRKC